jgi:molecular chaperone GrpE
MKRDETKIHEEPAEAKADDGKAEGAGPEAGATTPGEAVESVPREKYQELLKKAEERDLYRNELLRERADFSNYQKRVLRDRPGIEAQAVRRFVIDLLPVLDNFDRALAGDESGEGIRKGIEIVRSMLVDVLRRHGFEEIDALGKPFDPFLHEAVSHEESSSFPPDTVCEVTAKGYTQGGVVVRAAKVKVARAPADIGVSPGGAGG